MRYTLKQLDKKSEHRPQGYREEVLAASKELGNGVYELSDEAYQTLVEKYRLPNAAQLITNVVGAVRDLVVEGVERRTEEEIKQVLAICKTCNYLIPDQWDGRCGRCGCRLGGDQNTPLHLSKVSRKAWHCPLKKW